MVFFIYILGILVFGLAVYGLFSLILKFTRKEPKLADNKSAELINNFSHAVKNPLAVILQAVEFLKDDSSSTVENKKMVVGYIEDAAKKINEITENFLQADSCYREEAKIGKEKNPDY